VRAAAWRKRRARGRRTASAFSYSTQPPRPVGELTMAAEAVGEAGPWRLDAGVRPGTVALLPLPGAFDDMPALPGLPTTLDINRAAERLKLAAPTLDELLSSRKDKRLCADQHR
jgi:hypothetical protein